MRTYQEGEHIADAHIGPAGMRLCGAPGPEGEALDVVLVGDSMVFGKAIVDEDTLCAALQRVAASTGRALRFHNLGLPGAGLKSYDTLLSWFAEHHDADLAIVALLLPNDAHLFDVNDTYDLVRDPVLQWVGAALDPGLVLNALHIFAKLWTSEGLNLANASQAFVELADVADASDVPTYSFVWSLEYLEDADFWEDGPQVETWEIDQYDAILGPLAAQGPVRWLGPARPFGDMPLDERVMDQGHPTRASNDKLAAWLFEQVPELRDAPVLP